MRKLGGFLLMLGPALLCSWVFAQENGRAAAGEREAHWLRGQAAYLIEVGKYLEAHASYDSAYAVSADDTTRADILLLKAQLLETYLDDPGGSLALYRRIQKLYPASAESACFREGLALYSMGREPEARQALLSYERRYPSGRVAAAVEAILEKIQTGVCAPQTARLTGRPAVRVRLYSGTGAVTLSGPGTAAEGVPVSACYRINLDSGVITINGVRYRGNALRFTGSGLITVACGAKKKTVRGAVQAAGGEAGLQLINIVDIEDYLCGVVPSESNPAWPQETLKAQAIAARTYALYQTLHRSGLAYDLVDDDGDQMYGGITREDARSTRAVRDTEGLVATYDGKPILAYYMANSGGHTADAGTVFGHSLPYLKARPDPESMKGAMARWEKTFSSYQIETALSAVGVHCAGLQDISPETVAPCGRVVQVRLTHEAGVTSAPTRSTLKRALNLPELLFTITRCGDRYVFTGRGWGHGVGYSQWGAAFMGRRLPADRILQFYYPGTQLTRIWI